MGIDRFYTESIAVYEQTTSTTYPFDTTWSAVSGSPYSGSATSLSGNKAIIGGAVELRADMMFCLPSSVSISTDNKIMHRSVNYDVIFVKPIYEYSGHHQQVYATRADGLEL